MSLPICLRFSVRPAVLATSMALGALTACSRGTERTSEIAATTAGFWQRAAVTVTYSPAFTRSNRQVPAQVVHRLRLERDADPINPANIIVALTSEGPDNAARFRALRDMTYALQFAPDGHALGVTNDGGSSWTVFDLAIVRSPFDEPFWCSHRRVAALDPWPSSRALVLEILAEANPSSTAHVHRAPDAPLWPSLEQTKPNGLDWQRELRGAVLYGCKHGDDPELRAATVEAFVQAGNGPYDSRPGDDSILHRRTADLALGNPAILLRLRTALTELRAARKTPDRTDEGRLEMTLYLVDKGAPAPTPSTK